MKLTFMGTAGARFMVAKQLAASGGLYLEEGRTRISLDPGPGAIVQYAKRKVDLTKLDAIVLSHRHLDHSGDVNVMIEAMTEGGFHKRGRLFCPSDALDDDPVVLNYLRRFPEEIVRLAPETSYSVGEIEFATSPRHVHQSETYGFRFGEKLGWITDSGYYDGIAEQHKAEVMVIHVVLMQCRAELPHLCLDDAERIIREAKPRLAILTHYGMTVWRAHPWELAAELTQKIGIEVKAARDGMAVEI
ncbi:MAG TPA: MBL fold metallo-hydrolase [Candidatus Dormibacteraeota bacterium]|jgi:phosphoribosyl 1,2-cyclic phosphodiesterase